MPPRAGRWARRRAERRLWGFLRRNVWIIAGLSAFIAALATAMGLLLPSPGNLFVAGFVVGGLPWIVVLMAMMFTGGANAYMGGTAEQWTSMELRAFVRRQKKSGSGQWQVFDHIPVAGWDIDHVLVGPQGVVAVESKWSADGWETRWAQQKIADAAQSARFDAHKMESILRSEPHRLQVSVEPVVVLWPIPREPQPGTADSGEAVVYGHQVRDWCQDSLHASLDDATVTATRQAIADFIRMREAHELKDTNRITRLWYRFWLDPLREA